MKISVHKIFFILFFQLFLANICLADSKNSPQTTYGNQSFKFINVTESILNGACESKSPFGFTFAEWDGLYFFTWSHFRKPHCAWKWDGKKFNFDKKLSDQLSNDFCCGWAVEALDIDGDGDIDLTGRTSEGKDGWQENRKGKAVWRSWPHGDREINYFYDADGDGDVEVFKDKNFFDANTDGKPESVELPFNCRGTLTVFIDLEPDGDTDVMCFDAEMNEVRAAQNNGYGVFSVLNSEELGGVSFKGSKYIAGKSSHLVADLNNDGFSDVFVGGYSPHGHIYLNNGGGRFTLKKWSKEVIGINPTQPHAAPTVAAFDFDNDCDLDIATFEPKNHVSPIANATIWENQSGGNCIKVPVKPGDRVTAKHDGKIIFSHEYVIRNMLSQPFGYVHVGIGELKPEEVDIDVE